MTDPANYPLVFNSGGTSHAFDPLARLTLCGRDTSVAIRWRAIPPGIPRCGTCARALKDAIQIAPVLPSTPETGGQTHAKPEE